jgi:5'(3')-deoxyribonucleotidase
MRHDVNIRPDNFMASTQANDREDYTMIVNKIKVLCSRKEIVNLGLGIDDGPPSSKQFFNFPGHLNELIEYYKT